MARDRLFPKVRSQNTCDWELGVLLPTSSPTTDLLWDPGESLSLSPPQFPML